MLYSINNYLEKVSFLVLGFQFHFIEYKFWNLLQLNRVLSRNFCLTGGGGGGGGEEGAEIFELQITRLDIESN